MEILKTINVSAGYEEIIVIENISINVCKGEIVFLLGPNGAGKTTLIKSIVGIAKIFNGEIFFNGKNITNISLNKIIKEGIGYVPQLDNVFTDLTVKENLEIGAYILKDRKKFEDLLNNVFNIFPELSNLRNKKVETLSGGERQMLALARAMIIEPKLLILDEPTANLAPKILKDFYKKITELNEKYNISFLIVEQNVRKALEIASRIYVLVSGKCVLEAEKGEIKEENIKEVFLRRNINYSSK
ncbi:MAG: ABC transporter ATP-binding protein [Nitrososphaerota archaeon]